MKKEEAKKALEQLNNNEPRVLRGIKQMDYAALANKKFRTKK